VERGVPIDGVGLQTHLLGVPPEPGVIADLIARLSALGVEVALTEVDIVARAGEDPLAGQAADYAQVVEECLGSGCREITMWGLDDGHTWLDGFLDRADTDPLLFDADLEPKPAYESVRAAVAGLGP
jgi:endo-1,4-beta-xylanase